jgi:hypothetical protein
VINTSETAPAMMRRVNADARDRMIAIRSPRIDAAPPFWAAKKVARAVFTVSEPLGNM